MLIGLSIAVGGGDGRARISSLGREAATSTRSARSSLRLLRDGDVIGARRALAGKRAAPSRRWPPPASSSSTAAPTRSSEAMASAKSRLRLDLERNLGVLGTLGNNAPFIGLFGTVLGIIKAFADLSRNQAGGAAAVMSGISEALVATAVGLMVAIPAVIAFNFFQSRVRRAMGRVDAMAHLVLSATATAHAGAGGPRRPPARRGWRVSDGWRSQQLSAASDDGGGMIVDINVTPLVDITLVLLIIFMVTASYIVSPAIKVDLPKAASGSDRRRPRWRSRWPRTARST